MTAPRTIDAELQTVEKLLNVIQARLDPRLAYLGAHAEMKAFDAYKTDTLIGEAMRSLASMLGADPKDADR